MSDSHRSLGSSRSRFPWIAVAFLAPTLAIAVWTLMRYSYAWDPASLQGESVDSLNQRYLAVEGLVQHTRAQVQHGDLHTYELAFSNGATLVCLSPDLLDTDLQSPQRLKGRLVFLRPGRGPPPLLYVDDPRIHDDSAVGLVVGAIGILISNVLVLRWMIMQGTAWHNRRQAGGDGPC